MVEAMTAGETENFVVRIHKDMVWLLCRQYGREKESRKMHKKTRHMPRKCTEYSLTKTAQYDTMTIHTVILCLFLDFTSNMVILSQIWAAVK